MLQTTFFLSSSGLNRSCQIHSPTKQNAGNRSSHKTQRINEHAGFVQAECSQRSKPGYLPNLTTNIETAQTDNNLSLLQLFKVDEYSQSTIVIREQIPAGTNTLKEALLAQIAV